jgi:hypothetical protein
MLYEIFPNSRYWHPLKGSCQEKTAYHRKKVQFFLQGHHPVTGLAPCSLPAPVISKVKKNKIDGCGATILFSL